ncbi:MAG TPA: ABC transporter ATP-binding protein [Arachidicoccus sp.]
MNTLTISNLTKTYPNGIKAIDNVSLEIENGMFGLLGPNGAGKSSLMKTIVGLQKADNGSILFNNKNVSDDSIEIQKHLGFLPQDFGVYPKVSTYDLMNHIAVLKGVSEKKKRKEQILELLHKVNLHEQIDREVYTFSGGMKQRFGVAQALLGNPKIILVDEPTAGLDPEERNRFNLLLSSISKEMIVVLSTHLVEDVKNLCEKMAIVKNGKIISFGTPSALVSQLDGRVWTKQISIEELPAYQSTQDIISYQFSEGNILLAVYAEQAIDGFDCTEPTLEHFYFHTLNKQS